MCFLPQWLIPLSLRHLQVCFLPGSLILGATKGLSIGQARKAGLMTPTAEFHAELAANVTHTCYEMYNVTATGLAPEIVYFNTGVSWHPFWMSEANRLGCLQLAEAHGMYRSAVPAVLHLVLASDDAKFLW